jgi:hypothetical protein
VAPTLVKDVPGCFGEIPDRVAKKQYLGAWNRSIPFPRYTSQLINLLGSQEHFQGVQRIGRKLVLSGSRKRGGQRSQLIVVDMASQTDAGPWALPDYGYPYKTPAPADETIDVIDIDENRWHAGGIQALDGVLAVPIYGTGYSSQIRFFEFGDPAAPRPDENLTLLRPYELESMRLKKKGMEPKAVGMAYYPPKDCFILAVWDDEELHFHASKKPPPHAKTKLRDGFEADRCGRLHKSELPRGFRPSGGTYQNINLVTDGGTVFLVAARNIAKESPTTGGVNFLDLFWISWKGGDPRNGPRNVLRLKSRQIKCKHQQGNFGAGAGIYVDDANHMYLYSSPHWLHGSDASLRFSGRVNFNEYSYRRDTDA